jgi:hypothetical protein
MMMYNYSENTNIEPNSIFWVLLVAVSLSLNNIPVTDSSEEIEILKEESFNRENLGSLS